MINSHLYAWRVDLPNAQYLGTLGVFRYMNNSWRRGPGTHRVIFKGNFISDRRYFNAGEFIQDWPIDCSIMIKEVKVGRADDFDAGREVALFEHCIPIRAWIPHLVANNVDETNELEAFIDVECYATWFSPK